MFKAEGTVYAKAWRQDGPLEDQKEEQGADGWYTRGRARAEPRVRRGFGPHVPHGAPRRVEARR